MWWIEIKFKCVHVTVCFTVMRWLLKSFASSVPIKIVKSIRFLIVFFFLLFLLFFFAKPTLKSLSIQSMWVEICWNWKIPWNGRRCTIVRSKIRLNKWKIMKLETKSIRSQMIIVVTLFDYRIPTMFGRHKLSSPIYIEIVRWNSPAEFNFDQNVPEMKSVNNRKNQNYPIETFVLC